MEISDAKLYSVFTSPGSDLFQTAKAILDKNNIRYFAGEQSQGEGILQYDIKVFGRDKIQAERLLLGISPGSVKMSQVIGRGNLVAVVVVIIAVIILIVSGLIVYLLSP